MSVRHHVWRKLEDMRRSQNIFVDLLKKCIVLQKKNMVEDLNKSLKSLIAAKFKYILTLRLTENTFESISRGVFLYLLIFFAIV